MVVDGRLYYGGGVHTLRLETQLEGIEEPNGEDDVYGRAEGERSHEEDCHNELVDAFPMHRPMLRRQSAIYVHRARRLRQRLHWTTFF